jgi:hypothetical protein
MEDGTTHQVGPGSVFAIPTPVKHDLVNVGKEMFRPVAFFRSGNVHTKFRQRDDATEEPHARHPKSRGLACVCSRRRDPRLTHLGCRFAPSSSSNCTAAFHWNPHRKCKYLDVTPSCFSKSKEDSPERIRDCPYSCLLWSLIDTASSPSWRLALRH